MPQDQRYGRQYSSSSWDDERDRDYGRGRDEWRGESRSYRSGRYENEAGYGSEHDRRQDRDYQGTLRAGSYGRYEEEDDRSYPERYRSGGSYGQHYGESEFASRSGGGGYEGGSYGESGGAGGSGRSRSRNYGGGRASSYGSSSYGGGSSRGYGSYGQSGGSEGGGGFGSYVSDYDRRYGGGWTGGGYAGAERGYVGRDRDYGGRNYGNRERGWWDRATDEVSSWFGDRDAERRREMDEHHAGRGPKNYARSDDRIREDVSDRLTDDPLVDASDIDVTVQNQEVTLTGTVSSRNERRLAEETAESVSGVKYVQNNLRVKERQRGQNTFGGGQTSGSSNTFGSGGTTTM